MTEPDFTWAVRVYWEDTDAGGVVYYANYLKFLERARTEWLRGLGIEQTELAERDGVLFVVRRVEADYLRSARFNDMLAVECRLVAVGRASMTIDQRVMRGDEALLTATVKAACVKADQFRPVKIPAHILERFGKQWN
ncbi:MAG: tol-pal system-associated acyl-CoA thioesterase [Gallionellaceae bacterium]|nr:tol-pal system-associated acyl-CoA thioesterase [Gallionellaceae bacterium]MDD5364133.1 tol-pal system-associated acyl-CoA thioesterase [Gallionellaceae bacterium]